MRMESWGMYNQSYNTEMENALSKAGYSKEEIKFIMSSDAVDEEKGDSTYQQKIRNSFYPSNFDAGVRDKIYRRDIGKECPLCPNELMQGQALEVDHCIPVVEHFNSGGYRMSQEQRRVWYNTTGNLQLTHKECNRRKSGKGYHFNPKLVQEAIRNFH